MKKQFHEEFEQAAMWLSLSKCIIAQLMFGVVSDVVDDKDMPTACTNGRHRMFNGEWMSRWNFKQQAAVMAHEVFHEILEHQRRRGNRMHELWNVACDIKVNNLLKESGFELPSEGVFDFEGQRFEGKSEEFIYDFLEQEQNNGKSPVPDGYVPDFPSDEPSQDEVAEARGRLQTAVELHPQGVGALPAELQAAINTILNPKERWYDWMRKYFTAKVYSGLDWTQLCRREYVRSGIISPPFQSDALPTVVLSVDQSGSISQELLDYFAGHMNSILMECKPTRLIVQYFDTEVHETEEFTANDLPAALRRVCGGGTSFIDCCKKAEETEAVVHVVLTDMYGEFPKGTTVPTIWASISNVKEAPFGDVVMIEMEDKK